MPNAGPGPQPAVPAMLRVMNERLVYDCIFDERPISRAEIARRTHLSKPTVSIATRTLEQAGLVIEVGMQAGRPGRASILYEPVLDAGLCIALDIGANFLRGAVCDLDGRILTRTDVTLKSGRTNDIVDRVIELVDSLLGPLDADRSRLAAVVVGSPGVVDPHTGELSMVGVIESLEGVALGSRISERLGTDVLIENDVNLATLAEQEAGHGREVDDLALIHVGTGLGAGLILDGSLHRGARGAAGEIDYVPFRSFNPDVDPSARGVESLATIARSRGHRLPKSPPAIFDAARAGDEAAIEIVEQLAKWIALFAAAIVAVVDVKTVILGGGIGDNPDLIAGPVRHELTKLLPYPPDVATSGLGDAAVLIGATAVARRCAIDHLLATRKPSEEDTLT